MKIVHLRGYREGTDIYFRFYSDWDADPDEAISGPLKGLEECLKAIRKRATREINGDEIFYQIQGPLKLGQIEVEQATREETEEYRQTIDSALSEHNETMII